MKISSYLNDYLDNNLVVAIVFTLALHSFLKRNNYGSALLFKTTIIGDILDKCFPVPLDDR